MASTHVDSRALDFMVRRDDLRTYKFVPAAKPDKLELQFGQVLMKVDKFAFTSNNVTYASFGDSMSYWNFFPAAEGWGRIPVWGFGEVIRAKPAGIKPGERFYGYFPMSSYVIVQPERLSEAGFFDGLPHRQPLHALYNQYRRTSTDPEYEASREDQQMLLRPLFVTSFLIDDFLADNGFFDARTVVLSSASSKTAYGLAFLLAQRKQCEVIGLTSAGHVSFVERLGCYDRVATYDQIASLPSNVPVVYVDMAGNGQVRSALHHHFGEQMKYSCAVGLTHWDQFQASVELPGPRPTLFFAPAQIKKRTADWGPGGLQQRVAVAWRHFMEPIGDWMRVVHGWGATDVERVYLEMLDGRTKPDEGHVLSLST
jgi:Protein of unknown function (DUF2855)